MADVFISYKREEIAIARQVRLALKATGCSVWWDEEVQGGQQWAEEIDRQVAKARVVVVLWSSRSTASDWVKHEASVGKLRKHLVPARLDECTIPPAFNGIQYIDFSKWDGTEYDRSFVVLRRRIRHTLWKQRLTTAALCVCAAALITGAGLVGAWARAARAVRCDANSTAASGAQGALGPVASGPAHVAAPSSPRQAGRPPAPIPDDVRAAYPKPLCRQDKTSLLLIDCTYDDVTACSNSVRKTPAATCITRPDSVACFFQISSTLYLNCYGTSELCEAGRLAATASVSPCVRFGDGVFRFRGAPSP